MKRKHLLVALAFALGACNNLGQAGDACDGDGDCDEGLHCHADTVGEAGTCMDDMDMDTDSDMDSDMDSDTDSDSDSDTDTSMSM